MPARKLIISRKGFDTTSRAGPVKHPFGGVPSPIFPDGSIYSLPIPLLDEELGSTYGNLYLGDGPSRISIGQVVEDLTSERATRWTPDSPAYPSPDIRQPFQIQFDGKTGSVAAIGPQLGHLRNQSIGTDDIFLFFGLFRRVEQARGRWRFVPTAPQQHVLFGWLQVGSIHVETLEYSLESAWYVAADHLRLGDTHSGPAVGIFPSLDERLVLSKPGGSASQWRLPRWFYPDSPRSCLTYHPRHLWTRDNQYAYVQRRGPGQEFVLDLRQYPEALEWFSELVHDLGTHLPDQK